MKASLITILFFVSGLCLPRLLMAQTPAPAPYTMGFVPASIAEVDVAFPIYKKWHLSGQTDIQTVTQGTYDNGNPFAYMQRFVLRPWLIYDGLKNMKLYLGYARNKKYAIEEAGNYETLERRLIVMGAFAQKMPKGTMFEQVRFEMKFFDDRDGVARTIPRLRARYGINHYLRQRDKERPFFKAPNISYYAEIMFKFPSKSYAKERFDILRQSVYYSGGVTKNLHFLLGIIAQMQLRTNGKQFDVYYGPIMSFRFNIVPKARETFDNVDGGAD
jgi:hypothetical protein